MFGLFVLRMRLFLSNFFLIIISLCLFMSPTNSALAEPAKVYKARILVEGALVYQKADFDSAILGTLKEKQVFEVSFKSFSGFHRIRVGNKIGYIIESDLEPLNFEFEGQKKLKSGSKKNKSSKNKKAERSEPRKKRPFALSRFVGPAIATINFTENTMGSKLSESETFFGVKLSGTDVLIEGDIDTEINLMFRYGAPGYYDTFTGQSASGWNLITDFQLQHVSTLSPIAIGYFGFGPMFRFSKFDVALKDSGVTTAYSATDMVLGAAFSLGMGFRAGAVALRSEFKYYWEKTQYSGLTAAMQFEF